MMFLKVMAFHLTQPLPSEADDAWYDSLMEACRALIFFPPACLGHFYCC